MDFLRRFGIAILASLAFMLTFFVIAYSIICFVNLEIVSIPEFKTGADIRLGIAVWLGLATMMYSDIN
jgi:hypothetical protein|tara:strand:+ start:469 stop:672 length:204 start_codon:yes stop_codon:yes gene_type:complete